MRIRQPKSFYGKGLILNALFYIIVVHGTQIEKAGEIMGSIFNI